MSDEPAFLLVDGHNIIFAWEDLCELHRKSPIAAREALANRLRNYQDFSGVYVALVFDGKGTGGRDEANRDDDIRIIYATVGQTADAVIEQMVARGSGTYSMSVATGDLAEAHSVMGRGAFVVSPRTLREMVDASEEGFGQYYC